MVMEGGCEDGRERETLKKVEQGSDGGKEEAENRGKSSIELPQLSDFPLSLSSSALSFLSYVALSFPPPPLQSSILYFFPPPLPYLLPHQSLPGHHIRTAEKANGCPGFFLSSNKL